MTGPYAESGTAAGPPGTGWPGPPFDPPPPPAGQSNGPPRPAAASPEPAAAKPPLSGTGAALTVALPPGAVQVMAVDPSRQFVMVRTDPRMTDDQFRQYVADTRAKTPPELWPRIVILPAAQFTVLG